jgi:hypothetical protein
MRMEQKLTNSILLASGPPRCCSTTLIKGMPPNFRSSDTSCTRFLSMASSIESVPTAWLASLTIALTGSACGCAWELFGRQDSDAKVQKGIHARLTGMIRATAYAQ